MGEIVDVLAQEIFVRRAAREKIDSDVEQHAEELARQCYLLAEGFLRHARRRSASSRIG